MKKKLVFSLLLVLAIGAGMWALTRPTVDNSTLTLYGNVDIRQISLAFEGSDRVAQMHVEEGDKVKAGQVLATLDTRTLTLQLAQAQAQLAVQEQGLLKLQNGSRPEEVQQSDAQVAAARAQADLAAQQLSRLRQIAATTGGRGVSRQEIDSAVSQLKVAQAELENRRKAQRLAQIGPREEDVAQARASLGAARAERELLQHRIDLAELKAPRDATIRARLLEPGDMASPQRAAYTLAITDPKWIRAYVNETQLGHIRSGMQANVYTDSFPDAPVSGKIGYISSVAEFTPKSVQTEDLRTDLVYEVRILVDDGQDRLRLGMPATVRIALDGDAPARASQQ